MTTHPSYKEAQRAKRIVTGAEADPLAWTDAEVRKARLILSARGDYLSRCQRAGPRYRGSRTRRRNADPSQYAHAEVLRLVQMLRDRAAYGHMTAQTALDDIRIRLLS